MHLRGEQLHRLVVGVVASTTARSRGSRGRRRRGSSRPPARACRRGCRRSTTRTARPRTSGLVVPTSASVSRMNTSGDHVIVISSGSRPTSSQWPRSTSRLWAHSSGLPPKFEWVAWRGDDPQRLALAAAADPDRRVRLLQRLRVALGAGDREVRALVGGVGLGPHALHDLDAVARACAMRIAGRRELVAVGPELAARTSRRRCPSRGGRR